MKAFIPKKWILYHFFGMYSNRHNLPQKIAILWQNKGMLP